MSRVRGRYLVVGGVAVVGAILIALFASGVFASGKPSGGSLDNTYPTALASVTRRSLTEQTQVSATLGYASASSVVMPAGTTPSNLSQAQQLVTTGQAQLDSGQAALAADGRTLLQAQATLGADRAKLAVDCSGDQAGQSAPAGTSGAGAGSSPCATDAQAVSADEQSVTQDNAKVATDREAVASASAGLGAAQTSLAQAQSSATIYGQSSTYTELPAVGQIVRRGQTLYELSGQRVVALYGPVAPYRAFMAGMSPGRDVAELNANLRALGYGGGLTGDAFTAATGSAIDAFQRARGLTESGTLLLGSVVFEPGPVRVTSVTPTVGATVQAGPVLTVTSLARQVTIDLDAGEQTDVKVGDRVSITLPDNSTTPGRVSYVGTVATTPSSGDQGGGGSSTPTIEVDVTPTDPTATGHLDQAPVNVSITEASVRNVLVVPVDSLLALASGGYAVEEVSGGVHHLVGVNLGLFDDADGYVQVTGAGLAPGQRIVVPAE
jgi:hypothetical protein